METKTHGTFRTELSGYLFGEVLKQEKVKSQMKELGVEVVVPKGENDIIFLEFPESNLKKMYNFFYSNGIKTIRTYYLGV